VLSLCGCEEPINAVHQRKEKVMKRTILIITLSLAFAVAALAQTAAGPAQSTPSADQILDKFVQAIGGKAAIEKLNSRMQKGTLEIPAMGVSATFESFAKAPDKTVTVITIPGFGVVSEGSDGNIAWSNDPQSGLREKSGAELADAKRDAVFHQETKFKELYPKMTVVGKQKVGEVETWVIEATPKEGSPEKWYFDAQTGLLIRRDLERESPQGKMLIEAYLENYKEVDGIKTPFTVRQVTPAMTFMVKIDEVKHNVPVEDAKFAKPSGQ
jgi:hypothetical protein